MRPKRIQRKRTKGWRMPDGAVYVGRPSRWGNPYKVGAKYTIDLGPKAAGVRYVTGRYGANEAVRLYRDLIERTAAGSTEPWMQDCLSVWNRYVKTYIRDELAGRDLACWCPLDDGHGNRVPCHADVLLELANGGAS